MGGDAMPYETILYEKKGPVLTITLNRADTLNAINPRMTAELHAALDQADADAETRAIILTGAGRGFSAGFDIARRPDGRSSLDATGIEVADYIHRWWARDRDSSMELMHLWHITKPIIAAVHGWVMGGGFWYALASYNAQRAELIAAMQTGGLKAFLEARDGGFRPQPFGPKSAPKP